MTTEKKEERRGERRTGIKHEGRNEYRSTEEVRGKTMKKEDMRDNERRQEDSRKQEMRE